MALTDKLTSIAAAIREKGGTTELLTLDAMPTAIAALPTGGGGDMEPIVFTGNCNYIFANDNYNWLLEKYADKISFNKVDNYGYIFTSTKNFDKELPFVFNCASNYTAFTYAFAYTSFMPTAHNLSGAKNKIAHPSYMFAGNLSKKPVPDLYMSTETTHDFTQTFSNMATTEIGTIHDAKIAKMSKTFGDSYYLRHCPNFENATFYYNEASYTSMTNIFSNCFSMRTIPYDLLKNIKHPKTTSYSASHLVGMFYQCHTLDEIDGINPTTGTITSNMFGNTFYHCFRLKRIKFLMNDDGTPMTASWKNQTIYLDDNIGYDAYSGGNFDILGYNSGITADKEVKDKATYEALKNDPDWYTKQFIYSRFNHDSAVELINSLPDTSAYLATQSGGTNTVKFKQNAGNATDGGSVSALTEEEIAVAAAKGWTIGYTA